MLGIDFGGGDAPANRALQAQRGTLRVTIGHVPLHLRQAAAADGGRKAAALGKGVEVEDEHDGVIRYIVSLRAYIVESFP